MSPYEVVNLIQVVDRHDPEWIPFTIDRSGEVYRLICVEVRGPERIRFETVRVWLEDITDRGIEIPDSAFNLFMGMDDVRERQKALRA